MSVRSFVTLFRDAAVDWWEDNAPRLAAALAFYTALSLSPLFIMILALAGLVFGDQAARAQMLCEIRNAVGPEGTAAVEIILAKTAVPSQGIPAMVAGVLTVLIGATGVFVQLRDALNTVWEVEPGSGRGVMGFLKSRLLSLAVICGLGLLLLVSLGVNASVAALGETLPQRLPGWDMTLRVVNFGVSLAVTFLLFTMIFKLLPQVSVTWSDVWGGAAISTILFTAGKYLFGLYLGWSAVGSAYGAAGSFVVLLLWLYYSSLILLYGAEFTQVCTIRRHGVPVSKP